MRKLIVLAILVSITLGACNSDGFKTTDSGIKYKFILQNDDAQKAIVGDILELKMKYTSLDSVVFNSEDFAPTIPFKLIEPMFDGDIMEGIGMMGLGDSAIFVVSADSFFLRNVGMPELPTFIPKASELTFYVSLISIKTKEVFEKEQMELQKQKNAMSEIQRNEEAGILETYLKQEKITTQPRPSGLFYVETKKGSGSQALTGTSVQVHYKGMLLNGKQFDSSYDRNEPISFKIGSGQVIPGFEEGISLMKEGGKATLIIPSEIGYRDNELENIPPFSTLLYEVELVKVD